MSILSNWFVSHGIALVIGGLAGWFVRGNNAITAAKIDQALKDVAASSGQTKK